MNQLPSNIRKELVKIVPLSILNEVVCFAFYDDHPRDTKSIDVIVCTQRGEVREYHKREVGSSYWLQNVKNISEIKILRNRKCDLFYLVLADDSVIILSRKEDKISVLHEISNISSYSFEDIDCNGQARLKIIKKDDAVPLIFDDNFETLQEINITSNEPNKSDTLPLLVQLKRKLSEAQYCVKFNECKYKQLVELRQEAIFHIYQSRKPDDLHTSAPINLKEVVTIRNILQVESNHPEVRLCNKKLLIVLNIINRNLVPLEDVTVLLHTTLKHSITYTTRLYKEVSQSPYWQEKDDRIIESNSLVSVIAVIYLKELQHCANSKIQFEVFLSYHKDGKSLLLPFEQVVISAGDIMGQDFDILSRKTDDEKKAILCLLSSCEKNILHLKHIVNKPTDPVTPHEIFCTHLKMVLFGADNVVIHNSSPYHILHGVMVIFTNTYDNNIDIEVYTRSPSQVLALIHYIYDAVPHRIIALTPNIKMTSLEDPMEIEINEDEQNLNLEELGKSLINQTTLLKEYFDECLIKMNESKNPIVREKVGREIDIAAQGRQKFLEFRQKWLDIAEKGIRGLKKTVNKDETFEMMVD